MNDCINATFDFDCIITLIIVKTNLNLNSFDYIYEESMVSDLWLNSIK